MKVLFRAGATLAAFIAGPALAADIGVPLRAVPVIPVGWDGFYVGANAGMTWSKTNQISVTTTPGTTSDGGGPILISDAGPAAASASGDLALQHKGSFIGGAQAGYNWQISSVVAGLEADIQGVVGSEASISGAVFAGPVSATTGTPDITTFHASRRLDYLATVRGRLGYLVWPSVLVYGTGGLAAGSVSGSVGFSTANSAYLAIGNSAAWGISNAYSEGRAGWAAGGGVEWMFTPGLTLKGEYLYYDLGTATAPIGASGPVVLGGAPSPFFTNNSTMSTRFIGNILRVGLNYKFNGFPAFPRF
jgi:outer membrane immunogenic protein